MADRIFDTGTDDISTEVTDGVMTITLNRPKRRNAMSNPMLQGLVGSLAAAEVASDVGADVLTGHIVSPACRSTEKAVAVFIAQIL